MSALQPGDGLFAEIRQVIDSGGRAERNCLCGAETFPAASIVHTLCAELSG